jgi:hypothetical protein
MVGREGVDDAGFGNGPITCNPPPQWGQWLKSIAKTRFNRAIQLIGMGLAFEALSHRRWLLCSPWGGPQNPLARGHWAQIIRDISPNVRWGATSHRHRTCLLSS